MKLKSILLVIIALAVSAQAQQLQGQQGSGEQQQSVTNEDGGRAFIIGREPQALCALTNRGRVISEPQQDSIFLGSSWARPLLRARESGLTNLLANVNDQATLSALDECGVKNLFGPTTSREKLDDLTGNISDLDIQAVLAGMLKDGTLQRPNANTIYLIFLDPQLHSKLGSMIAGKHYVAYHNFFNASGTRLHYVVVPFEADSKTAYQIALRALVSAVVNPSGSSAN